VANKGFLNISEKLLLAAYEIEDNGICPFSAEDLVVAAWRKFHDAFGLAGYHGDNGHLLYPDSNRVYAEIMGTKPIRKSGYLIKVGRKLYQLTEAGRVRARDILKSSGAPQIEKAGLAREVQRELKRLFISKASEKYKKNRIEDITFHDACVFWRISPMSSAIEFKGRISNLERIIESAKKAFKKGPMTFEHSGQTFTTNDLNNLLKLHQTMMNKFKEDINVILKRTDERS
jgi:hypothetical protein